MNSKPVALVTGSANRVGRALALALAKSGYDVAVHYHRSREAAQETCAEIKALGRRACILSADLRVASEAAQLITSAKEQLGVVTCLVNNASVFHKDTLSSFSEKNWNEHFAVHALTPLSLIQSFTAQLPKEQQGNVVNILDGMWGWSMSSSFLTYTLSKMTLWNLTALLARELAPNIRINAIAPGSTIPGVQDKPDTFDKIRNYVPLKRNSAPDEVSAALLYLLGAPSVTGQVIELGGGARTPHHAFE